MVQYFSPRAPQVVLEFSGLGEAALAFTAASSKSDQATIADLLAAHGADGFAAAWLRHKEVAWAAELLPTLAPEASL